MIKIENVEISNISRAIYSARNAMNSWDKSDSDLEQDILGSNDLELAKRLVSAGTDHRKFMRMIPVYVDITAPQFWWSEFDTYKIGTVRNSCSKMHKIHIKEFIAYDFSHDGINEVGGRTQLHFANTIIELEWLRQKFNETGEKKYWRAIIELLPSGYNMKATVMLNYEVLANMYKSRKAHKLDEWIEFCKWIEPLPYSELITGEEK